MKKVINLVLSFVLVLSMLAVPQTVVATEETELQQVTLTADMLTVSSVDTSEAGVDKSVGNLLDDDQTTFWATTSEGLESAYLQVDLGVIREISRVDLATRYADGHDRDCTGNIRNYIISVSTDGTTWKEVATGEITDAAEVTFTAVDAQYIKVTSTSSYHWDPDSWDTVMCLSEIAVYEVPVTETENEKIELTESMLSVNSSDTSEDTGLDNLLDNNNTTYWASAAGGNVEDCYLIINLGEVREICKVDLENRYHSSVGYNCTGNIRNYTISVSTDGTNWKKVAIGDITDKASVIFNPVEAQYIKVTSTSSYHHESPNTVMTLSEIAVYGTIQPTYVKLGKGETYTIESETGTYDITDDADGVVISSDVAGVNVPLHNHTSNTANSLSSFSTTANTDISLEDALFTLTATEDGEGAYTIYNETKGVYLTNTGADSFFNSGALAMKVAASSEVEGTFNICQYATSTRYIIFYNTNMDFNTNSGFTSNWTGGSYNLLLLKQKDSYATTDIIPGYEQATSIDSGSKYLIAHKDSLGVYVLYPTNGKANQTKLVGTTLFNDLYAIGSTTTSGEDIANAEVVITSTDSGYTIKSGDNYFKNDGSTLLTTTETYFDLEAGSTECTFRLKDITNNNRYYVFDYSDSMFDMSTYNASWTGGSYDLMLFEKTETIDLTAPIPGYKQASTVTSGNSYIIAYSWEGAMHIVYPQSYAINNANCNRTVSNDFGQLTVTGLSGGQDTMIVNGVTYIFNVADNLALGKTATVNWADGTACTVNSSRPASMITDGTINLSNYCDFGEDNNTTAAYVQIDLGSVAEISEIDLYRYYDGRTYRNTVIALSGDEYFTNPYIVHNTDASNVHGLGAGTDSTYSETSAGKTFILDEAVKARYVRVYMNGQSDTATTNHIVELEVYGYTTTQTTFSEDIVFNAKNNTDSGSYLFEGYYDSDKTTLIDAATFFAGTDGYAKYVNPEVLTVKGQAKANEDGTYTFRFVSSVTSINLEKVGFEITKGDTTKDISTKNVYKKILATEGGEELFVNPENVFNAESEYFFVVKVNNVPADATDEITIKPYWIPADGTDKKIYGTERTFTATELISSVSE